MKSWVRLLSVLAASSGCHALSLGGACCEGLEAGETHEAPAGESAELLAGATEPAFDDTSELLAESERLSRTFSAIADRLRALGDFNVTMELLSSFQVCSTHCRRPEDFERFGESVDGGYEMCAHPTVKPQAGYSIGVGSHDKWSYHLAKRFDIVVNQFDCFRVDHKAICQQCRFFEECITTAAYRRNHSSAWTFDEMLQKTGGSAAKSGSLILKMDIEGDEWKVLAEARADELRKFGQMAIEFHNLSHEDDHKQYLAAMKRVLGAGFKVAHLHGNNQGQMYYKADYQIPNVIEVTLALEPGPDDHCIDHVADWPGEAQNNEWQDPLPPSELPPKPQH